MSAQSMNALLVIGIFVVLTVIGLLGVLAICHLGTVPPDTNQEADQ